MLEMPGLVCRLGTEVKKNSNYLLWINDSFPTNKVQLDNVLPYTWWSLGSHCSYIA